MSGARGWFDDSAARVTVDAGPPPDGAEVTDGPTGIDEVPSTGPEPPAAGAPLAALAVPGAPEEPDGAQASAPAPQTTYGSRPAGDAASTTILPIAVEPSLADLGPAAAPVEAAGSASSRERKERGGRRTGRSHRIEGDSANEPREDAGPGDDMSDAAVTTMLKPMIPEDRTAVIPKLSKSTGDPDPDDGPRRTPAASKGVTVIPLRPVRTGDGYKSVYSEVTRSTPVTVLRAFARGTGEVLITFGLIVLLFAAYEVWGKAAIVDAAQSDLDKQLAQDWGSSAAPSPTGSAKADPGLPPPEGDAIARLYIPRMGKHWVVVQGVRPVDIKNAPGHYPDTAMPGQVGNFSVAGHRTPAIFWDMDKIQLGDAIVVETRDRWFVYTVKQSHVVVPTAVQVVAPVPNQPGARPSAAMLTLTTCNPKYNNYQRLIVHAEMIREAPRDAGKPRELEGI